MIVVRAVGVVVMNEQKLEEILHKLWLEFYENSTLTSMSDTYFIAQEEAKAAIQALYKDSLREARIDELTMYLKSWQRTNKTNVVPFVIQDRLTLLNRKED